MTDHQKALEIVCEQEKLLQFESFNNEDAWKLGNIMVEEMKKQEIDLAISIRKINGNIVFQYASDGTSLNNQIWMDRKFNTVKCMEQSSIRAAIEADRDGNTVATHGLSEKEYKFVGGGFPIRIKNSGLVMVAIVSNLPHEKDHGFVVDCLAKYLNVTVPVLDMEIAIP